jgi:hypothetical protein
MLLRRIFGIAKELFFKTHITTADDMFAVFPGTKAKRFTRGRRGVGFVYPLAYTSTTRGRKGAAVTTTTTSCTSIAETSISTTGGRRGRGLGASPAISIDRRGRSSPLRIPHMRRNISRFRSINAERSKLSL